MPNLAEEAAKLPTDLLRQLEDKADDLSDEWARLALDDPPPDGAAEPRPCTRVLNQDEIDKLLGFDQQAPAQLPDPTIALRAMLRLLLNNPHDGDVRAVAEAMAR